MSDTTPTLETAQNAIRQLDLECAPGSETLLLGEALDDLRCAEREGNLPDTLEWWRGAYNYYAAYLADPDTWAQSKDAYWYTDPVSYILNSGATWEASE